MNSAIEKAKSFVYFNARPLDLARWQYHFENGSKEAVLSALSVYQNEDGGFGHALEQDCFNPNSSPIQTWTATEILREIDFCDSKHPIIKGILKYLSSGADFDKEHNQWLNSVPSNNDYPCAVWWKYTEEENEFKYNPTACLAGFSMKYADKDSELYKNAYEIAEQAYKWFSSEVSLGDMHIISCFIRLYEYCIDADVKLADMKLFRQTLIDQVNFIIFEKKEKEKWGKEYVAMPSNFIGSKESFFYSYNAELIAKECEFIKSSQAPDGSFPVLWKWRNDYREFVIAENWWKTEIILTNMKFLREFEY